MSRKILRYYIITFLYHVTCIRLCVSRDSNRRINKIAINWIVFFLLAHKTLSEMFEHGSSSGISIIVGSLRPVVASFGETTSRQRKYISKRAMRVPNVTFYRTFLVMYHSRWKHGIKHDAKLHTTYATNALNTVHRWRTSTLFSDQIPRARAREEHRLRFRLLPTTAHARGTGRLKGIKACAAALHLCAPRGRPVTRRASSWEGDLFFRRSRSLGAKLEQSGALRVVPRSRSEPVLI